MEVIAFLAAAVVMFFMVKIIFGSWDELWDAFGFWLKPDFISWFQGEGFEDFMAELKLGLWILCGVGTYFGISAIAVTST